MSNITKITLAGALAFGLGAVAITATPAFARGGHGGTARQVKNGPDAIIVTTVGPNGPIQQRANIDNLAAAIAAGRVVPGPNVRVIGHLPAATPGVGVQQGRNRGGRRTR